LEEVNFKTRTLKAEIHLMRSNQYLILFYN